MAQKPLFKSGKKKLVKPVAPNRHGKIVKTQKGTLQKTAKKPAARQAQVEKSEITKGVNKRIEERMVAAAASNGLRLSTVRPAAAETKVDKMKTQ